MSKNDFYFETLEKMQGELTEESLVQRLEECNVVLNEITNSRVWDILLKDAKYMIQRLDDTWQDFPEGAPQLKEARIVKMASKHIFDLPIKYAQEVDMLRSKLMEIQNPEEYIEKDSDNG